MAHKHDPDLTREEWARIQSIDAPPDVRVVASEPSAASCSRRPVLEMLCGLDRARTTTYDWWTR